jgi:hypothetical protein
VLWPHVNPKPLAPDSPASFDWHSTRAGEKVTVHTTQRPGGIGVAHLSTAHLSAMGWCKEARLRRQPEPASCRPPPRGITALRRCG